MLKPLTTLRLPPPLSVLIFAGIRLPMQK